MCASVKCGPRRWVHTTDKKRNEPHLNERVSWFEVRPIAYISFAANFEPKTTLGINKLHASFISEIRWQLYRDSANFGTGTNAYAAPVALAANCSSTRRFKS